MFLAIAATVAFPLAACNSKTTTAVASPVPITIEFAEIDSSAPERHLFDKEGEAIDLGLSSSISVNAVVASVGVIKGNKDRDAPSDGGSVWISPIGETYAWVEIPGGDGSRFKEWNAARVGKMMAMVVGDQVVVSARIGAALPASTSFAVPGTIRSAQMRDALAKAPRR